jgi:hypothetical protein
LLFAQERKRIEREREREREREKERERRERRERESERERGEAMQDKRPFKELVNDTRTLLDDVNCEIRRRDHLESVELGSSHGDGRALCQVLQKPVNRHNLSPSSFTNPRHTSPLVC